MLLDAIIEQASSMHASDIHIHAGLPVKVRIDGELVSLSDQVITNNDCNAFALQLLDDNTTDLPKKGEMDFARTVAGRRIRANVYYSQGTVSIALRILSDIIPTIESLNLPKVISTFPTYNKGIILVTGETGSGKSTTLAAILNTINHTRKQHIITLEDPIEYVYEMDQCLISQREIGTDTDSYADGLNAILREDPDVILIGELRNAETIDIALTAAETGHLVFATLHTNSAIDSVDRIVGSFSADHQQQIRLQLSTTLKAVVSQQLLVRKEGKGRVAACEVMIVTPAIKNQIREGKTPQMESSMLTGAKEGSITMDNYLLQLMKEGIISEETALDASNHPETMRQYIQPKRTIPGNGFIR